MSASSIIDRVKSNLVGLKMPRALEILDVTLRGIERGEITAIEAVDALDTEELTSRENRCVKMAVEMAKLGDQDARRLRLCLPALLHKNRVMVLAGS